MDPNNPVERFYYRNPCQFSNKCRHEKPSYSKDFPILTSEFASSSNHQQENENVQQTLTNEPTSSHTDSNLTESVEIQPKKSVNKLQEQDPMILTSENKKLVRKVNSLENSVNTLRKQLKREENKNTNLVNDFNKKRLNDEDYKCLICLEVFIKPKLLNCSHMFCEWCIDKWLVRNNQCPTCWVKIESAAHCLNMDNFIKRMVEQMPNKAKIEFKKSEKERAKDKPQCKNNHAFPFSFNHINIFYVYLT
ncbi:E3 ubiquitin-protein ligase RNF8-like [Aphis craccivora]|uniref:E3 ubiquitin-protein ligase RNF8-like n=1 Tax=Aphis craccivora TaxID=307492 RepID=A0A6G0ZHS8_APHCR|nr:E3 ubiquitin-protein ligase RNF8-like [Aphis craccivora]